MSDEPSRRPLPVIEAELRVTRLAVDVCDHVAMAAAEQRYRLLEDGWPTTHPLCVDLDVVAERWAAHATQQRRAVDALASERVRGQAADRDA